MGGGESGGRFLVHLNLHTSQVLEVEQYVYLQKVV